MESNIHVEGQHPLQDAPLDDTPSIAGPMELPAPMTELQGPIDVMKDDGSAPTGGEDVNVPPVAMVLKNVDLLQMILAHFKPEGRDYPRYSFGWTNLRLVSPAFNTAVLTLPHPSPIALDLNKVFSDPCAESPVCLAPGPYPLSGIPSLLSNPDLSRRASMVLSLDNDCDGHFSDFQGESLDVEGINFLNFSSVFGSSFRILNLRNFKENTTRHFACILGASCGNLREMSITTHCCHCDDDEEVRPEPVHLSATLEHLRKLSFEVEWHDYENWGGLCPTMQQLAKGIINSAPNLEVLEWNDNMPFDLGRHTRLKRLKLTVYPLIEAFDAEKLNDMLRSRADSLVTFQLAIETTESDTRPTWEVAREIRFPAMSQLRTLELSFLTDYNFGPSIAPCVFNSAGLESLTITSDDQGAIGDFLQLLRDNYKLYRTETLTRLEIRGDNSGISDISNLNHLHHAFPNLRSLNLAAGVGERLDSRWRGKDILKAVFLALAQWKELEILGLKVNFPLEFGDMCKTLEGWEAGNVRELRVEVENHASLFPDGPRMYFRNVGDFQKGLLALKGMRKVVFVNFMMPGGVAQALVVFIQNNGLPMSFMETPTWM